MFADYATVKFGEVSLRVKRLTLGEIRKDRQLLEAGDAAALSEERTRLISEHVKMADGSPVKPDDLTLPQMRKLMVELVGLPESGGVTDFIGLLC